MSTATIGSGLNAEDQAKLDSLPKSYFSLYTQASIAISTDPDAPTYLSGCVLDKAVGWTLLDATTGVVKNTSGRTISFSGGSITLQLDNGTGGTAILKLWSERSDDDFVTFAENERSLRSIPISNNTEASQTKSSKGIDILPGESIRFAMYNSSGGSLSLTSPTDTVNGGSVIDGESAYWEFFEV